MALITRAKSLYDRLKTLSSQFMLAYEAQMRSYRRLAKPQKNMLVYVLHFMRVLAMSIERGEIKASTLVDCYGIDNLDETLRLLHNVDDAVRLTPQIIAGEKKRIAMGGRPIYNPTIGMVATHFDIFLDVYEQQHIMNDKADRSLAVLKALRAETDKLIIDIWNAVEAHFADLPTEARLDECRRYGLIYYYRSGERRPE